MGYFVPGDVAVVVLAAKPEAVRRVASAERGIVTLDDGSKWYEASGLPVAGGGARRITAANDPLLDRIERHKAAKRLQELTVILEEAMEHRNKISLDDLLHVERALLAAIRKRAAYMADDRSLRYMDEVSTRARDVGDGAVDDILYRLSCSLRDQPG